ncbi:MAG: endonuclease/exonuclease/phosphatase family protein [Acidimicrobiales bacterium]
MADPVAELTVASFNVQWGRGSKREGWPAFDLVEACRSFDADVIALQEAWAPDGGVAQHDEVAAALGFTVVTVPMGRAVMEPQPRLVGRADPTRRNGDGDWCLALLSRPPIRTTRVTEVRPQLPLDPWSRVLLQAELDIGGTNLTVVATHFSHLEHGSPLQAPSLRRGLPPTDRAGAFLGDMNMWGWTISALTPAGWRRAVRGKTWPAHRPDHQIDHLLVTPSVEVIRSDVLPNLGSDHRPIRARLRVT